MTRSIGSHTQRISWHCALLIAVLIPASALADTWQLQVGAESPDRGRQALAFLPNEIWIHAGDSIRWTFPDTRAAYANILKTRPDKTACVWAYLRNSGRMSGDYARWIELRWSGVCHHRSPLSGPRNDDSADLFGDFPDCRKL